MLRSWRVALFLVIFTMLGAMVSACGSTDASSGSATSSGGSSSSSSSSSGSPQCVQGTIQVTGSTALQPLAKAVATQYQNKCSGANITVGGGGSSTGLKNAQDGSSAIGNSDIFAPKATYPDIVDNQVAVVVFSIVINSKVTGVTNLTSAQLKSIYTGQVKNWQQLGGPNLQIVPVSRPAGSGTRVTFEQFILGTKEALTGNPVASSSGEVANTVKQTDGAVSYVATAYAKQNGLTTIKIDGVDDDDSNVQSNSYKFWNIEHMYTKGSASGLAKAFIDYMKSPDTASIRLQQGFLDISSMSPAAITAKTPAS